MTTRETSFRVRERVSLVAVRKFHSSEIAVASPGGELWKRGDRVDKRSVNLQLSTTHVLCSG